MSQPSIDPKERRAYFRVRARLAMRTRPIGQDKVEAFEGELARRTGDDDAGPLPRALTVRLERLERKLDHVLALLDANFPRPLGDEDERWVELSGGGIRYDGSSPFPEPDDDLLIEMLLPAEPPRLVRAVGRVVRLCAAESPGDPPSVAVAFRMIDETDRAAIVRFSYDVQRAALRARSAGALGG